MEYNSVKDTGNDFLTYGIELEWSDTDRSIDIPETLGKWEGPKIAGKYMGSEIDIVNTKGKWKGVGTDPLAITCPVGGEINVQPASSPEVLLNRVMEIMDLFPTIGTGCVNHGHIHVGLGNKLTFENIKNIFAYTEKNELTVQAVLHSWNEETHVKVWGSDLEHWVKEYLQYDGCRTINPNVYQDVKEAKNEEKIRESLLKHKALNRCWITGESEETEHSHRTAINLFNLTKGETIEIRCLRSSINPVEIYSSLTFIRRYFEEAIKGEKGKPVVDLLKEYNYKFPTLDFNLEDAMGWQVTRHKKGRSGPFKKYSGTLIPHDTIYTRMNEIVKLCQIDLGLEYK